MNCTKSSSQNLFHAMSLLLLGFAFSCTESGDRKSEIKVVAKERRMVTNAPVNGMLPDSSASTSRAKPTELPSSRKSYIQTIYQESDLYNWHVCLGTVLDTFGVETSYSISKLVPTEDGCKTEGGRIILEYLMRRDKQGKPVQLIVDEIEFPAGGKRLHAWTPCRTSADTRQRYFFVSYPDKNYDGNHITQLTEVWEIDFIQGQFRKIPVPKGLQCEDAYYAEGV